MELKTNQHSVYSLTYHAVFVTKYRRQVIDQNIMALMKATAERLLESNNGSLLEFNGEPDHIHLLFEIPPQLAPSSMVCVLKAQLSKVTRRQYHDRIKDKLWKDVFWSDSYFLSTTGGASIEVLEEYIRQQGIERPKRKYTRRNS